MSNGTASERYCFNREAKLAIEKRLFLITLTKFKNQTDSKEFNFITHTHTQKSINIKISSIQQCKIQNVWHPIKNYQAFKAARKYDPYKGEKINKYKDTEIINNGSSNQRYEKKQFKYILCVKDKRKHKTEN